MINSGELSRGTVSDRSAQPLGAVTMPEAFQRTVAARGSRTALRNRGGTVSLTWDELDARVRRVAAGLAALGLRKGETMAEMMQNTIECHIVDLAAAHLGAVPFGIFNSSAVEQIAYQFRSAEVRIVVTQRSFLDKVEQAVAGLDGQVEHVIVVDGPGGSLSLEAVEEAGDPAFSLEPIWQAISEDDIATLIFTSGTTGPPKAALWSNRTIMAQLRAMDAVLPMPRESIVSFLPMAHAGGRINGPYQSLIHGATITVCPDMKDLGDHIADARPDALFAPPRIFEKLQVAIEAMVEAAPDEADRVAGRAAIAAGLARIRAADGGRAVSDDLVAEHERAVAVLHPILERLGLERVRAAYIGGAPCAPEIIQFFGAVGVPLLEAYGATEVTLNIFNRVDDFKTGTAGKALPGVELKLAEDDELLVRADLNMIGYRNAPELTASTIDLDGWLHTGDIARIDDDGFVTIVDRKKEIIINSAGKNMSPALIESAVRGESSLVGQIVAVGDGRRYVTALVTLDAEAVGVYSARLGLRGRSVAELAEAPELHAEIGAAIDRANTRLNSNEQIKKFVVLPEAWLPDSEELTPTAKLKRRVIHAKYADRINGMYAT